MVMHQQMAFPPMTDMQKTQIVLSVSS